MKNKIKKDFTIIPNQLINDTNLSRDARFLFVYLCSKPEDWKFYNKTIEKELCCSKDSRIKYSNELKKSGWMTIEQKKNRDGSWGENQVCLNPRPIISDAVPNSKKAVTDKNGSGEITPHNKKDLKQINKLINNKDIVSIDLQVLNLLNEKKPSSRPFEPTASNLKSIKARIKEKFTFEDFKKVIEFKVEKWSNDPKMKKYIRPATLFGEKFNSYLIESEETTLSNQDGSNNFKFNPQENAQML